MHIKKGLEKCLDLGLSNCGGFNYINFLRTTVEHRGIVTAKYNIPDPLVCDLGNNNSKAIDLEFYQRVFIDENNKGIIQCKQTT